MAKGRMRSALPVLALAAVVAGCATGRDVMEARLEIAAPTCEATPNLATPTGFTQKKKDSPYTATVRFADTAACMTDKAGNKSTYAVLDLPAGEPGIITVTSFAMGSTVFSPRLEFRDEKGVVTREVGREAFLFSNGGLQAQLRQRAGEKFMVIASDAPSVGKSVEQIQSTKQVTGVMAGGIYVPVHTGGEARAQLMFAHNGEVTTTVAPMPKADD